MYDFKASKGTFKGLAGEAMFRIIKTTAIPTHFIPKERILSKVTSLNNLQIAFLSENWCSIDSVDLDSQTIYEIKTKNDNVDLKKYPLKLTDYQIDLFTYAQKLGFSVKICLVWLHSNWKFTIEEKEFNVSKFYRETPVKFDKRKYV